MELGGPVWHVSVASHRGIPIREILEMAAERQLAGVGGAGLGEWREWTGYAFHLRRRLSVREQRAVGPVVDIRGTDEARARARRLGDMLAHVPADVLLAETGIVR
jgi:hypothetical protein